MRVLFLIAGGLDWVTVTVDLDETQYMKLNEGHPMMIFLSDRVQIFQLSSLPSEIIC